MRRRIWAPISMVALLAAASQTAAAPSVRSAVDSRRIGVEDVVQLTLTVEGGAPPEVPLPTLTNLRVVGGPSTSQQVSFVNGQMSQSVSWTYLLKPEAPGKAEVGAVNLKGSPADQSAPAIPIEVVPGSVRPQPSPRSDPFGRDPLGNDPFDSLFGPRRQRRGPPPKMEVEAAVSRTRLHVGEPLRLVLYLYTQASVGDWQYAEAPRFPGFWVEDLKPPQQPPSGEAATRAGEQYRRVQLDAKLLFPTKAGRLTIPPSAFRFGVPARSFFDSGSVVVRSTKEVGVLVEPLPSDPGFDGAVGKFQVAATIDPASVALGEATTLRFRVSGEGNLKWIEKGPEVRIAGARVYPPEIKSEVATKDGNLAGSKTWEYVVVAETAGRLDIPALPFTWFDPVAGRLAHSRTSPMALEVRGPATAAAALAPPTTLAPSATRSIPLRTDLDAGRPFIPGFSRAALALAALVAMAVHGALFAWPKLQRRLGSRGPRGDSGRDPRSALRDLDRLDRESSLTKEAAAEVLERALHTAFGPIEDEGDALDEGRSAALGLVQQIRFLRYAPQLGEYSDALRALTAETRKVIRRWA